MPNTPESIDELGIPKITMQLSPLESIPTVVDPTLSNVGEAAEAKAVGDAIAELQDSIDGKNAETLYMDDTTQTPENTIAARIEALATALQELAASNVSYGEGTVEDALNTIEQGIADLEEGLVATAIPMSSTDETTIGEKLTSLQDGLDETVKVTDQTQIFTNAQKAQARTNIGALSADDVSDLVSTTQQTLTETQKTQARENIGAASANADTLLNNAFLIGDYSYVLDDDIAAGATLAISKTDLGITDPTGYKMAGIIWFDINAITISVRGIREYTNGNFVVLKNFGTAADGNGKVFRVRILWVKAGLARSV